MTRNAHETRPTPPRAHHHGRRGRRHASPTTPPNQRRAPPSAGEYEAAYLFTRNAPRMNGWMRQKYV
jgi:hypothetical protein